MIELTRHAIECRCAHALVLPPFYFKGVGDAGCMPADSA